MANWFGYDPALHNTSPDEWMEDGYVLIGGLGAPTLTTTNVSGLYTAVIVTSVTRTSTGLYVFHLSQPPAVLGWFDAKSIIPSTLSPAYVGSQLVSTTIGQAGVVNPTITVQFNASGVPTDLPAGSGIFFEIRVKVT